jgi:hypothetical protein
MPAVRLNQLRCALLKRDPRFLATRGFSPVRFPPFSVFTLFCSSIFWPFQRLAVRTRAMSLVLGLSFYPLEQAPNMVIYAMSKSGDSNERSNLSCGVCSPKRH